MTTAGERKTRMNMMRRARQYFWRARDKRRVCRCQSSPRARAEAEFAPVKPSQLGVRSF